MYKIKPCGYVNDQPWMRSLPQRIGKLFEAKKNQFKVVVYLYEGPDTSTFRYRVYNMCQALDISLHWRGVYFYGSELVRLEKYLHEINLLIVARFRWTQELDRIIKQARRMGIKVLFEVDDMVYDIKYLPLIVNTLSVNMTTQADYDYWFAYISRLNSTAKLCDAFITTNEFLAEKMRNDLNVPGYVIQNFINRLQEEVSENYYSQKEKQYSQGAYVIGYFSGTPSHINDFLVVAPELKKLLEKYDDITLRLVGFMELPSFLAELERGGRIERVPLVNFLDLQKEIAEVDVNIVPLVNNEFSNCKSELKYYEASIVGTVTCATPAYVFCNAIDNEVNGYLCERGQWFDVLETLYLQRKRGCPEMIESARRYCVNRYAYYNQTQYIEELFERITV